MSFLEALRKKALKKTDLRWGFAINAAIEALREMAVGEPMKGKLEHVVSWDQTFIRMKSEDFYKDGLIGSDGEEVAVIILRYEEVNQNLTKG